MSQRYPDAAAWRVEAGRRGQLRRRGLTPEGRARLQAAAIRNRPWTHSTGPRTSAGKARSAANGQRRQKGELSVRQLRAELGACVALIHRMRASRRPGKADTAAPSSRAGEPPAMPGDVCG
jgi:hypothetical protein